MNLAPGPIERSAGSRPPHGGVCCDSTCQLVQRHGAAPAWVIGSRWPGDEQSNGGDAGRPYPGEVGNAVRTDTTNRQDRHTTGSGHHTGKTVEPEQPHVPGLRSRSPHGAGGHVVDVAGEGGGLDRRVHRPTDQEAGGREAAHDGGRDGIRTQVDTVGTRGEGDIDTVVDDDPSLGTGGHRNQFNGKVIEDSRLEVALSKLDHRDAGIDGEARLCEQTPPLFRPRRVSPRQPAAIGDEVENHGRAWVSASSPKGTS